MLFEIIFLALGIAVGIITTSLSLKVSAMKKCVGTLDVVYSEEEPNPYIFLELEKSTEYLVDKDNVILQVKKISHK